MKAIIAIVIDLVSILVSAFCGMIIWNWFMPPLFSEIPTLTFGSAIGLSLVLTVFDPSSSSHKYEEADNNPDLFFRNVILNQVMNGITKPVFVLVYAWIAQAIIF